MAHLPLSGRLQLGLLRRNHLPRLQATRSTPPRRDESSFIEFSFDPLAHKASSGS